MRGIFGMSKESRESIAEAIARVSDVAQRKKTRSFE